jgi:hypothetical protein
VGFTKGAHTRPPRNLNPSLEAENWSTKEGKTEVLGRGLFKISKKLSDLSQVRGRRFL